MMITAHRSILVADHHKRIFVCQTIDRATGETAFHKLSSTREALLPFFDALPFDAALVLEPYLDELDQARRATDRIEARVKKVVGTRKDYRQLQEIQGVGPITEGDPHRRECGDFALPECALPCLLHRTGAIGPVVSRKG